MMIDDMMQTREEYMWLFINSDYLDDLLFDNFDKAVEVYNKLYINSKISKNSLSDVHREEVIDAIREYPNINSIYSSLCYIFGFNPDVVEEINSVNAN